MFDGLTFLPINKVYVTMKYLKMVSIEKTKEVLDTLIPHKSMAHIIVSQENV